MIAPPEGAKMKKPNRVEAWCPYCGSLARFVWDGELGIPRCPGCGISCRDFYVRKYNGLFSDGAMAAFERAVLERKREDSLELARCAPRGPVEAEEPPTAAARGVPREAAGDAALLPGHDIWCPTCGARVRRGFYPVVRERCPRCGAVFDQPSPDAESVIRDEGGLRCPKCGQPLGRPEPGVALMCPDCGEWAWVPGDRAAERAAKEARAKTGTPKVAAGEMEPGVLARVQALARRECAAYLPDGGCAYGRACVFLGDGASAARCGWFEGAVLPLDRVLQLKYCRRLAWREESQEAQLQKPAPDDAGQGGLAGVASAPPAENGAIVGDGGKARICPVCQRRFEPRSKWQTYCGAECQAQAARARWRESKRRKKAVVAIPSGG